jgi:hypothetical protein
MIVSPQEDEEKHNNSDQGKLITRQGASLFLRRALMDP